LRRFWVTASALAGLGRGRTRHAEHRPGCRKRSSLRQRAHHGAVFVDAVLHPDRPEPPLEWDGPHHGLATGYPGYDGRMPFENGMLPEMLRPNGYNAFCLGKWHLSPSEDNTAAGPFHRWSLGRGFERFYGSAAPTAHPIRI
jgi:hypothetical protein